MWRTKCIADKAQTAFFQRPILYRSFLRQMSVSMFRRGRGGAFSLGLGRENPDKPELLQQKTGVLQQINIITFAVGRYYSKHFCYFYFAENQKQRMPIYRF